MAKIVSDYNMSKERGIENEVAKPDIIMIMSESFWNPKILENVTYPDNFMEDYERIEQDGIQNGLMPYQGLIKKIFGLLHNTWGKWL